MAKYLYRATSANRDYKSILKKSRNGINLTEADLKQLIETVTPLIRQYLSPYQLLENHYEISCSTKTIYNYIELSILNVKNLDLTKKVNYKLHKPYKSEIKTTSIYESCTYNNFISYITSYPDTNVIEMDTVVGCEDIH